jgi:uncharacterized protein YgiM (DUF1202 family)
METPKRIESSINHETSRSARLARSLKKFGLSIPSSAWVGLAGIVLAASVLVTHVPSAQAAAVTVSTNISALNVRNGPGTGYGLNGRPLRPGETVQVVRQSGGWYQLPDGGWFSSSYASPAGSLPGTGGGGTAVNRTVTATTTVNVRNGPGTGYSLNGRPLYAGETVRVIRQLNGWYQLPDGGWFTSAYTSGYSGGTGGGGTGSGGTAVNRTVRATTTVNVRNGPGTGYSLNGRPLYAGETVRVVRESGGWYQLPDGGWFSSSYATSGNSNIGGPGVSSAVVATNGSNLVVRSSPSGSAIGSLANGTVVRLTGQRSGGYTQLSSGGWVSSSWLR